jgi:hypothetical protein
MPANRHLTGIFRGPKGAGKDTRFKPGDPRINRLGRRKTVVDDRLREEAEHVIASGRNKGKTYADLAVAKQWARARKGDLRSFQLIADRLDGRAIERQEVSGPEGKPLRTVQELDARIVELLAQWKGDSK